MYEKKDTEEERSPERIKQHRASVGVNKLTQNGEIPIRFRCARRIAAEGAFETGREHGRTKPVFEPGTEPAQYCATQCVEHSPDHDRDRNDHGEHQKRVAAPARQDAIIDLKQIDGRSKEQQIIAATIGEHDSERACAGPERRLQRGLGRRYDV